MTDLLGRIGSLRISADQLVLRTLILLVPMLSLVGTGLLAGAVGGWTVAAVAALAAAAAVAPDSHVVLVLLLLIGWHWGAVTTDVQTPWALWVAGCMLVTHAAAALAATAPPAASFGAPTWRRWGLRTAVIAAATTVAWLLAVVASAAEVPAHLALFVAGVALLLVATVLLRRSAR